MTGMPGRDGLVDRRVQRVRIVRVDDDRVDVGSDQVADVGQLTGRVRVVVDDGDLVDRAGRDRLGLDRADRRLAPAVADAAAVGEADVVRARQRRRSGPRRHRRSRPRRRSPRLPDRRAPWLGSIPSGSCVLLLFDRHAIVVVPWIERDFAPRGRGVHAHHAVRVTSCRVPAAPRPLPRSMARARRRECSR